MGLLNCISLSGESAIVFSPRPGVLTFEKRTKGKDDLQLNAKWIGFASASELTTYVK